MEERRNRDSTRVIRGIITRRSFRLAMHALSASRITAFFHRTSGRNLFDAIRKRVEERREGIHVDVLTLLLRHVHTQTETIAM